ncbi:TetR family transcriptional regulator [Deinococcus sp. UYEF24]
MARWQTGAQHRLEQAALELFLEQGFSETTVPQIAARAGLTTRTFFRYFADKREVLFADGDTTALVERLMEQTDHSATPVGLIVSQLGPFAEAVFGARREALLLRHRIVETDQGLRERELRKMATLKWSIVGGFIRRGCDELTAALAADLAMSVLGAALERWLTAEPGPKLSAFVADALAAFRNLAAEMPR